MVPIGSAHAMRREKGHMMGLLDDISATLNRGTEAAGRTARTMKLKSQIADITRRRQSLAAQLGASLYEVTRDDPSLREGREELYDAIAAVDDERAACEAEIERLEAESAAAAEAARTIECTNCHARVSMTDRFCSGCGKPVDEIKAELRAAEERAAEAAAANAGGTCANCGAPVGNDDQFCTACGARIVPPQEVELVGVESVPAPDPAQGNEAPRA